jgi:hypothetical protein
MTKGGRHFSIEARSGREVSISALLLAAAARLLSAVHSAIATSPLLTSGGR